MATRVRQLLGSGRPYDDETVNEVIALVRDGGHIEAALETATARLRVAESSLGILPHSRAREILETLGSYLLDRVEAARANLDRSVSGAVLGTFRSRRFSSGAGWGRGSPRGCGPDR